MAIHVQPDVTERVRRGATPPAEWYTSDEVFRAEREFVFRRNWVCVGHVNDVAETGAFFTTEVAGEPVVVTRAQDGELRAFLNICRHRCSKVVLEKSGRRRTLQCHYHAWTYNLDGTLRSAPRFDRQPGFDREQLGLGTVGVGEFAGFIFVNLDPAADPLSTFLGPLPDILAQSGVDPGSLVFERRIEYDIDANWKIVVENYLECYHCPVAHRALVGLIDVDRYQLTGYEHVSQQFVPAAENGTSGRDFYDKGATVQNGSYSLLWPDFMMLFQPGPAHLNVMYTRPVSADRTVLHSDFYFPAGTAQTEECTALVEFIDLVQSEDKVLCESVQEGLSSSTAPVGYTMTHAGEELVNHFHLMVCRAFAEAGLAD
ncbi:MAG: choline monooxygenase [Gaiellales bacterium]|nr:choline monooxygenase [Gaiellales bacterium]